MVLNNQEIYQCSSPAVIVKSQESGGHKSHSPVLNNGHVHWVTNRISKSKEKVCLPRGVSHLPSVDKYARFVQV